MAVRKASPKETAEWLGNGLVMPGRKQAIVTPCEANKEVLADITNNIPISEMDIDCEMNYQPRPETAQNEQNEILETAYYAKMRSEKRKK
jgi:hypothetical protein